MKCDFSRFLILIITNFTNLYERNKNLSSFLIHYYKTARPLCVKLCNKEL